MRVRSERTQAWQPHGNVAEYAPDFSVAEQRHLGKGEGTKVN